MSLELNDDLRQSASYTDAQASKQLVPYFQGKNQLIPCMPKSSRMLAISDKPASRQNTLLVPLFNFKKENRSIPPESAYNSSRLLITPKMYQVGLLIDIYA